MASVEDTVAAELESEETQTESIPIWIPRSLIVTILEMEMDDWEKGRRGNDKPGKYVVRWMRRQLKVTPEPYRPGKGRGMNLRELIR